MALSLQQFTEQLHSTGVVSADELKQFIDSAKASPRDVEQLAKLLVQQQKLTPFQAQQLQAGKGKSLVLGNYVILDKLGQGGMGMVLKARHRRMDRIVALKVLSPAVAALGQIPSLTLLTLQATKVTDDGLAALAQLPLLGYLDVNSTSVSIEGLRSLKGLPLHVLYVARTQLQHSDLPELVELFPQLRVLDTRSLQGDVGAGLSPLTELTYLEHLVVEAPDVAAGAPHHLEQFPMLRTLHIGYSSFPSGTAPHLEQLPKITGLHLDAVTTEDPALEELGANTTLERLVISFWMNDSQLSQLSGMQKLRELSLGGTEVTQVGVDAFHELRPDVAITGDFNIPAEH